MLPKWSISEQASLCLCSPIPRRIEQSGIKKNMLSVNMPIKWLHSYKKKCSQNQGKAVQVREPLKNSCKEMEIFQSSTTQRMRETIRPCFAQAKCKGAFSRCIHHLNELVSSGFRSATFNVMITSSGGTPCCTRLNIQQCHKTKLKWGESGSSPANEMC